MVRSYSQLRNTALVIGALSPFVALPARSASAETIAKASPNAEIAAAVAKYGKAVIYGKNIGQQICSNINTSINETRVSKDVVETDESFSTPPCEVFGIGGNNYYNYEVTSSTNRNLIYGITAIEVTKSPLIDGKRYTSEEDISLQHAPNNVTGGWTLQDSTKTIVFGGDKTPALPSVNQDKKMNITQEARLAIELLGRLVEAPSENGGLPINPPSI